MQSENISKFIDNYESYFKNNVDNIRKLESLELQIDDSIDKNIIEKLFKVLNHNFEYLEHASGQLFINNINMFNNIFHNKLHTFRLNKWGTIIFNENINKNDIISNIKIKKSLLN